jgi:hypothetical protein
LIFYVNNTAKADLTDEEKKQLEEELARETATLADGFYKIFQTKTDKNSYATADWTTGLQATSVVNVFMTGSSDDKGHFVSSERYQNDNPISTDLAHVALVQIHAAAWTEEFVHHRTSGCFEYPEHNSEEGGDHIRSRKFNSLT